MPVLQYRIPLSSSVSKPRHGLRIQLQILFIRCLSRHGTVALERSYEIIHFRLKSEGPCVFVVCR